MLFDDQPYTLDRIVRIALAVALVWGVIWLLNLLSDVLIPFAVALLLAYLMNPLVCLVQRRVHNRVAAVLSSLALVIVVFGAAGALVVPQIAAQVRHMAAIIAKLGSEEIAARAATIVPADLWLQIEAYLQQDQVRELFQSESAVGFAQQVAQRVLPGVWGVISGTASLLMGVIGAGIVVLYLVFLLIDFDRVRDRWTELIPPRLRGPIVGFLRDFSRGMQLYFRGQAVVASIVGILFAVGFTLIGLPMGILLGLFIGLLNMVPYLQIIGLVPAFVFALLHALDTGGSPWLMLGLTGLVFAVVQTLQDAVLVPRIMGKVTGLSPAVILLSLSVWGKLLGLFGLLIALPMTVLLWTYYKRYITDPQQRAA